MTPWLKLAVTLSCYLVLQGFQIYIILFMERYLEISQYGVFGIKVWTAATIGVCMLLSRSMALVQRGDLLASSSEHLLPWWKLAVALLHLHVLKPLAIYFTGSFLCMGLLEFLLERLMAFLYGGLGIRVMYATMAGFFLRLLQCILGPMRRRSGHYWFVQYSAMAAWYLPSVLVVYVANAVRGSPDDARVSYVLACIHLILRSSPVCVEMAAYARSDNPPKRWDHVKFMIGLGYMLWCLSYKENGILQLFPVGLFFGYMWLVFSMPSIKPAQDRMRDEGCAMIPVKSIIQDQPAQMAPYRDICLSYNYSRLLTRLYFGIPCKTAGHASVHAFKSIDLQSDTGYKQVFAIVDVQLAFLHDHFFTYYHYLRESSPGMLSAVQETFQVLGDIAGYMTRLLITWTLLCLFISSGIVYPPVNVDVALFIFMDFLLEWSPRRPILPVYWRTLLNALQKYPEDTGKVYRPSVIEWLVERCLDCLTQPCWQGRSGQYSLVKDYDRRNHMKACVAWLKRNLLSPESPRFIIHHPQEEDPIVLLDSVKKMVAKEVAHIMRNENSRLTNGTRSLERYGLGQVCSWTLGQEARTILMWNIATSYCDTFPHDERSASNHEVATALSGYCTYLVAFLPDLLPWRREDTMRTLQDALKETQTKMSMDEERTRLQQVLQEIKCLLGQPRISMDKKKEKIQGFVLPASMDGLNIFEKGMKLGHDLRNDCLTVDTANVDSENNPDLWKVIADFWVEMILYVAPSENGAAHVDQLPQGGEFVTHLWALLSNIGIKNRVWDVQDPPHKRQPPPPYNV